MDLAANQVIAELVSFPHYLNEKPKQETNHDYVEIVNVTGHVAKLKREHAEERAFWIEEILKKQECCKGCNGTNCKQKYKGWLTGINGQDGIMTQVMLPCPLGIKPRTEERKNTLDSCNLPQRYAGITLENFKKTPWTEAAYKVIAWLIQSPLNRQGLYLYGPRNSGKSLLACLLAKEKAKNGEDVFYVKEGELSDAVRASVASGDSKVTPPMIDKARSAECLILDDLAGSGVVTPWASEHLYKLLSHRYDQELQTIVTCRVPIANLPRFFQDKARTGADSIGSRIAQLLDNMTRVLRIGAPGTGIEKTVGKNLNYQWHTDKPVEKKNAPEPDLWDEPELAFLAEDNCRSEKKQVKLEDYEDENPFEDNAAKQNKK